MAKRGPKPKPYITADGAVIAGLARDYDGRWRIVQTGQRFSESDEHEAVARFRAWERKNGPNTSVFLSVAKSIDLADLVEVTDKTDPENSCLIPITHDDGEEEIGYQVDQKALWNYVRQQLLQDPVSVATKVGIAQIANLASFDLPQDTLLIKDLIDIYMDKSESTKNSKGYAISTFQQMVDMTQAVKLSDLTAIKLMDYRDRMLKSGLSAGSIGSYFGRCKTVVAFGLKHGLDDKQLLSALARMKVLVPPKNGKKHNPKPLSKEEFEKLYATGNDKWKAIMIAGLNLCMYMSEVLSLQWDELDFDKKTFVSERGKTKVVRCGVLWDETISALMKMPKKGPFVFTSKRGLAYLPASQWQAWDKVRIAAKLPNATFDQIRDSAYTEAMQGCNDERQARVLAGHKSGMSDHYVKRNPHFLASAVEAIRKAYR